MNHHSNNSLEQRAREILCRADLTKSECWFDHDELERAVKNGAWKWQHHARAIVAALPSLTPPQEGVEELARRALLGVDLARTHLVQPVNGAFDYFYVSFAGQEIEFRLNEDRDSLRGPYGEEMAALSGKAAACATAINDMLYEVAKAAAIAALSSAVRPDVGEIDRAAYERAAKVVDGIPRPSADLYMSVASNLDKAAAAIRALSSSEGQP